MKRHILQKEDFESYEFEYQLAGSYDGPTNKSLVAAVKLGGSVTYIVYDHKVHFIEFTDISYAIESYNEIA